MDNLEALAARVEDALKKFAAYELFEPEDFETFELALRIAQAVIKDTQNGCKMVPEEATDDMMQAKFKAYLECGKGTPKCDVAEYKAMLEVAPISNTQKVLEGGE